VGLIERAGNEIAAVLMECCTVEECENTLAEISPEDWQRAAQKVLDLADHQGVVEENARLREALAHATTAVRDHATRLWQVAYEADRAAGGSR
jgi:hypothetical protein